MVFKKILILDLSFDEYSDSISLDLNRKIILICSKLIHFFLNTCVMNQIAIILVKNNTIEQISHLSGDKIHHNQGLCRIKKEKELGENSLKTAFFIAKKLLAFTKKNCEQEIIIFMGRNYNSFLFHSMGGFFIKNKIKFSAIMFYEKKFFYLKL